MLKQGHQNIARHQLKTFILQSVQSMFYWSLLCENNVRNIYRFYICCFRLNISFLWLFLIKYMADDTVFVNAFKNGDWFQWTGVARWPFLSLWLVLLENSFQPAFGHQQTCHQAMNRIWRDKALLLTAQMRWLRDKRKTCLTTDSTVST